MELAERRKNEPHHDPAQDHLVRKIFSKFRKPSDTSSVPVLSRPSSSNPTNLGTGSDIEKGTKDGSESNKGKMLVITRKDHDEDTSEANA